MRYITLVIIFFFFSFTSENILQAQNTQVEDDIDLILYLGPDFHAKSGELKEALDRLSASPEVYVDAIDNRIVLPNNENLSSYQSIVIDNQLEDLLVILNRMGWRNLAKSEINTVLVSLYYGVFDDIDLLKLELANNSPPNLILLKKAINAAEFILITILDFIGDLKDPTVLQDALDRYQTASYQVQPFIEGYSIVVAGDYPVPTDSLEVSGDWQLIGLPLYPFDSYFDAVFSDPLLQEGPYTFDGQYVLEDSLVLGKGYWIKTDTTGTEVISGILEPALTMDLVAGWNLISPPNCAPNDFHRLQMLDENNMAFFDNPIFGYDENGYYSVGLDFMIAGEGYWIQLESDATVTMDCSLAIGSKRGYTPPSIPDSFGILSVQDAAGGNQQLYFGGTLPNDFQANFSMPPRPFEGSFDARLAGDTRLTEEDTARIRIQARQYPLTIELTNLPGESSSTFVLEELIGGQVTATRSIEQGIPLQITNEQVSTLRVGPE